MLNKGTLKWFIRGFLLTALLLLVAAIVVMPTIGWAQGDDEENLDENREAGAKDPSYTFGSDDPLGRVPVTVVDTGQVRSNREVMAAGEAPSYTFRSDDPWGRTAVTVADNPEPLSNREAMAAGPLPSYQFRSDQPVDASADIGEQARSPGRVTVPLWSSRRPISVMMGSTRIALPSRLPEVTWQASRPIMAA